MKTLLECWKEVKVELKEREATAQSPLDMIQFRDVIMSIAFELMDKGGLVDPISFSVGMQIGMEVMAKYKDQEVKV